MKLFKSVYIETPDFIYQRKWWGYYKFTYKTDIYQLNYDKVRAYFNMADLFLIQDWEWLDRVNNKKEKT